MYNVKNNKHLFKFVVLVIFLSIALLAVQYFGTSQILHPTVVRGKILEFGALAPIAYVAVYVAASVMLVPGAPLTIAGGALFGSVFGTLYTVIGATTGATLAFLLSRFLGRDFVGVLEGERFKKLAEYDEKIEENGFGAVLFFRFVPLVPFNGLNFALGLTKVKFQDYLLGTILGIIPGTFAYVYLGDSVASLQIWNIIAAVLLLAVLSLGPVFFKRKKEAKMEI